MIKAIIIDDEMHCRKTLGILLKEYCPDVQVLEQCDNSEAGIEAIKKLKPDLVFLDIEIPFAVIFTTGYDQYAIKAIHFSALDYLLKPIVPKELVAAVHKIQVQKNPPFAEQFRLLMDQIQHKETGFKKIAVPTSEGFELILADQLIRCETHSNYTHLFLKNNARIVACRTLKEMEEQLQDFNYFLRVHHSYIVNLNEVTKYIRGEGGYLIMADGSTVNVSHSAKMPC
jgi:two-component system LytT family response regulator